MKIKLTIIFLILIAGFAQAAVENIPIKTNIELKPGQAELITINANEEMEIGWSAPRKRVKPS